MWCGYWEVGARMKEGIIKRTVFLAVAIAVIGCGDKQKSKNSLEDPEARKQIQEIKASVRTIFVNNAIESTSNRDMWGTERAELRTKGQEGYVKVSSPTGSVIISLEKVEPYLDDFNVYFNIGNTSSANLLGMSGTIGWGPEDGDLQSKNFELQNSFPPGAWTVVKITTGTADKAKFGRVLLEPKFSRVQLRSN